MNRPPKTARADIWVNPDRQQSALSAVLNGQTQLDARIVVQADSYMRSLGLASRGMSSFLRNCVWLVFNAARTSDPLVENLPNIEDALATLEERGYSLAQFKTWRGRQLQQGLQAEQASGGSLEPKAPETLTPVIPRRDEVVPEEMHPVVRKRYLELRREGMDVAEAAFWADQQTKHLQD